MIEENENPLPALQSTEELCRNKPFLDKYGWLEADTSPYILNVAEERIKPKYTLAFNGVPFAILGGLQCLTGQSGHGKTTTLVQFMAAILKGECGSLTYEMQDEIPEPKVLYIDTEQEKYNTFRVHDRVCKFMGWNSHEAHDNFKTLWLREVPDTEECWRLILKFIYEEQPTVVFIDGLLDTVEDFNDNKECQERVRECMSLATYYNISLWCIVHQNPGVNQKMTGHLGSFVERKATDVFSTTKEKSATDGKVIFKVSQIKSRGKDVEEWQFEVIDVMPIQIPNNTVKTPSKLEHLKELDALFRSLGIPQNGMSKSELQGCMPEGYKSKKSNGKFAIAVNEARSADIIYLADNGRYYFRGLNNETTLPEQEVLPFEPASETEVEPF